MLVQTMSKLSKLISLTANSTKIKEETKGNATKVAALQGKASAVTTKLAKLKSSATLADARASIKSAKEASKGTYSQHPHSIVFDMGIGSKAAAASASTFSSAASASGTDKTESAASMLSAQTVILSDILILTPGSEWIIVFGNNNADLR